MEKIIRVFQIAFAQFRRIRTRYLAEFFDITTNDFLFLKDCHPLLSCVPNFVSRKSVDFGTQYIPSTAAVADAFDHSSFDKLLDGAQRVGLVLLEPSR